MNLQFHNFRLVPDMLVNIQMLSQAQVHSRHLSRLNFWRIKDRI